MAKTILLDTRTANYLELTGNGRIYRVPPYQRDYSWKDEHWEDLWNDLWEMRGKPDERHYMGALVIEGLSDREFQIIDGQQRLATLSILALAVLKQLGALAERGADPEANRQRAEGLRNRFVGEKDPASLVESSKLFLNETDNAFYQDYLVQLRRPLNPRGLPKSNRLLWECFEYFRQRLEKVSEFDTDGEALAVLLNETVARQLLFILISVDDELNAYTVFETLNARGLEISSTDLLKNYLFSRVRVRADLEALQRRWRHLIATVRQERFPEFLRYHLLCDHKKVRRQRLFKMVRDTVRTGEQVFALMEDLEARAELFSALSDANHPYWLENPACRPFIRDLNLFGVRQMTPLLFAAWERFSKEDFSRVLKLVSVVSFRYTVVSGLNTNELEPAYHTSAKSVLDGRATHPSDVFTRLRGIYVKDEKFQQDFSALAVDTGSRRRKTAKYILSRLESDVSSRECDPDTDPATIEHILPENPGEEWIGSYPEKRWDEDVYRIGNLTLLESSANRRIGSSVYLVKQVEYARSGYRLSRAIPEIAPEQWTPELMEHRQRRFAERAVHLWRSDFA
ncbi:MAG: DUF262 domain-containing HNH endonuclease family protein [Pseudomonadota bacterium]|nr:DUF262 domain-containing HNH endonuclease family protein [Pseudomonadota bacterium]